MANTFWEKDFLIMCSYMSQSADCFMHSGFLLHIISNYALQTLCGSPHKICNEESKINGMRPNRSVKNDDGVMVDFIFGPAFICNCRGENLDSLSDEQIDRYGKMFRYPEHLARVNGTLFGIPYRPQPEQER